MQQPAKAYLLVCVDTFDRLRGDSDLGYFYPAFDDLAEANAYAKRFATGAWDPNDARDYCEAIIELRSPDQPIIHDPSQWLGREK